MEIMSHGTAKFRTRLMNSQRSTAFAKALIANPRFTDVAIHVSSKAKSSDRYFVVFRPASEAAQARLADNQQRDRELRAYSEGDGYLWCRDNGFLWCLSTSGEVYSVTKHSCDCPDSIYRRDGSRGEVCCKHVVALRNGLGTLVEGERIPSAA